MRRTAIATVFAAVALGSPFLLAGRAAAVEVVAAGDIATNGDAGALQTSNRVLAIDPDLVLTLGDNAYLDGTLSEFRTEYDPSWGRFRAITHPTPGNHDWHTAGAAGYETYFGVSAGRIHTFSVSGWRIVALDSDVNLERQDTRLASILANDTHTCELLYWHHPRWSSGENGDQPQVAPWWTVAYANGVDLILNGHSHDYERFAKKDPSGAWAKDGIREFVVGTGGMPTATFKRVERGSQVRITGDQHWGVLDLSLTPGAYSWTFVDADTGAALDHGSDTCHR